MKKHKIELSYKDLHAIKHSLEKTIKEKQQWVEHKGVMTYYGFIPMTEESINETKQDIEHETKLLERFTEKINYLKDLYKI